MAKKPFKSDTPRRDIYADVTARIIADMEAGVMPWARPWKAGAIAPMAGMPCNATTDRPYSGVNVLLLWLAADAAGFSCQRWATFNQARDAGCNVIKGSKGTTIVYASSFVPEAEKAKAAATGGVAGQVHYLKSFTVFNLDQIEGEGIDKLRGAPIVPMTRDAFAETVAALSPCPVRHGGDKAFYSPSSDYVVMPVANAFPDALDYSRTLAHEIVHATGHATRLDRKLQNAFGSKDYAREELVAEIGAAFLCASMGVEPVTRHADYVANWLATLREDNRAIFRAASMASKAADYLLAATPGEEVGLPFAA